MGMWQQCVGGRFLGVISVQKGKRQRNVKTLGKVVECVNCRGSHSAGDQKWPLRETQVEVSRVNVVQKFVICWGSEESRGRWSRGRGYERSGVGDIFVSKIGFLAFIAMVIINCTEGMECRSQKTEVMVAAAERYLCVWDLTSKELQGVWSGGDPCFQWPMLSGCWPEGRLNRLK